MPNSKTVTASDLIRESLGQIVQNRRQILPIMGLIWLLQVPSFFTEKAFLPHDAMTLMGLPSGWVSIIPAIIVMLAVYLGPAWSAVGWHRLNLLDEQPARFLPRWRPQPVLDYFIIWLFLPILIWGGPALAALLAAGMLRLLDAPPWLSMLPALPAIIVAVWLTLRLSPVPVSRAVLRPLSLAQAFQRTAHLTRALWSVAFLSILLLLPIMTALIEIGYFLADQTGYSGTHYAIFADGIAFEALYAVFVLLSISMANTIYRHMAPPTYS